MAENTPPQIDQLLTTAAANSIHWPLISSNLDTNGGNALTGTGITANGFEGNGFDRKLYASLPAWAQPANAELSLFTKLKRNGSPTGSWREVGVSVGNDSGEPKLELNVYHPPGYDIGGTDPWVAIRGYTGSVFMWPLNRPTWRFEFRFPELINGAIPLAQSLCWLDADNLLMAAYVGNKSVLYRWNVSSNQYTGRASSTTYEHINSMHLAQDGSVWCQCVVGGFDQRKRLDLATSFSTGVITESGSWNTGDVPTSSIAFATVGGTEYVLLSQFSTSVNTWVYVFLRSQMSGTVNQVNRVKRFQVGTTVQDLVQRASDGKVYLARSGSSAAIHSYDLAAILAGPDNTAPTPVSTYPTATNASEGLDFHPTTDRLWMATEGGQFVQDDHGHCAVWSTAMTGVEENSYLIDMRAGQLHVRLNGRLMHENIGYTPSNGAGQIQIGARSLAPAGNTTGYLKTSGIVRNVAIKSSLFTQAEFNTLSS